jgi:SNF family Na+-dependent transporter
MKVSDMPIEGLELAFVAYPAILASFPFAQFWSALFFLMLVSIGLGSNYAYLDSWSTIIYGFLQRNEWFNFKKVYVTLAVIIVVLFINLVFFASDAGYYWLGLFDHYSITLNVIVFLYIELYVFTHYLPLENLKMRLRENNEKFPYFYDLMITKVNPIVITVLIFIGIINEFIHPEKTVFLGRWLGVFILLLPHIVIVAVYYFDPWRYPMISGYIDLAAEEKKLKKLKGSNLAQ